MKDKTIITYSQLISKIKEFEGCPCDNKGNPKVYLDSGGTKTVGYGHTGQDVNKLKVGATITKAKAEEYLLSDLSKFTMQVMREMKGYKLTYNQLLALTSFCYNIGTTSQLTDNNKRTLEVIADKILLYTKCNGKELQGLVKRRKWESDLFKGVSV